MPEHVASLSFRFRGWAPEHLGYSGLETRVMADDGNSARPYVVGIRGQRFGGRFVFCGRLAWVVLFAAILVKNVADSPPLTVVGLDVANSLFATAMVVFAVAEVGKRRTRKYVWIDVREAGVPLGRGVVERTRNAVTRVRRNPRAPWTPTDVLLVSGSEGFEAEALALADSAAINCYRWTGSGFEQVRPRETDPG